MVVDRVIVNKIGVGKDAAHEVVGDMVVVDEDVVNKVVAAMTVDRMVTLVVDKLDDKQ